MLQRLVNHNTDIKALMEKGFALSVDEGFLIIRDIPYIDSRQELKIGAFVTKLVFIDENKVKQDDHQVFFTGDKPCDMNGSAISHIGDRQASLSLSPSSSDIVVQRRFSIKPSGTSGYADFFAKIESYISIISGPAICKFDVTPYTFRSVDSHVDSVFNFHDTLSARAEITDLSNRFKEEKVAIIGLGGTGSYILDFIIKTPVKEIVAFDADKYYVHNSFRSPGRTDPAEFDTKKAELYLERYSQFRKGLNFKPYFLDSSTESELDGVTFAFVAVDNGPSRAEIFDILISRSIPFIDVGMGINRQKGMLSGLIRTTHLSVQNADYLRNKGIVNFAEHPDDEYKTNIQIGELNALNACFAVMKYKQLCGFYSFDDDTKNHFLFDIVDMSIVGENYSNANEN